MEKLFDETFSDEHHQARTLWYGYFEQLDDPVIAQIIEHVATTLKENNSPGLITSWIFYRQNLQGDALEENVRSNVMIKHTNGNYTTHYNMSDFEFVVQFDAIQAALNTLNQQL